MKDTNERIDSPCGCNPCAGAGCRCGCQNTAKQESCGCGEQCRCGAECACTAA